MGYYFVCNMILILFGIFNMFVIEIGIIICVSYIVYGFFKFIFGLILDELNFKIFFLVGLFFIGLVNVLIGVIFFVIISIWFFIIMYFINGWL